MLCANLNGKAYLANAGPGGSVLEDAVIATGDGFGVQSLVVGRCLDRGRRPVIGFVDDIEVMASFLPTNAIVGVGSKPIEFE